MADKKQETIRINREFIDRQRRSFAPGNTMKELLAVSVRHPFVSLIFILSLAILGNSIFSLLQQLLPSHSTDSTDTIFYFYFLIGSGVLMGLILVGFKISSISLYRNVELYEKKALIVIASVNSDYTKTAAYNFINAMLYGRNNSSKRNLLEKVYILCSENNSVNATAKKLKKYCEDQNRVVEILEINIDGIDSNVELIKKQIDKVIKKEVVCNYKPSEIIADITGGTKEISVALYLSCLNYFILPAYLNVPKKGISGEIIN